MDVKSKDKNIEVQEVCQPCGKSLADCVCSQLPDTPEMDLAETALERQAPQADPLHGRSFIGGRYKILSLLGIGGMGSVYKVEHQALGRVSALKVLNTDVASERKVLQRFDVEAKAVSQLSHPNLLAVHDYGVSDDGLPYLVMDYIEGTSLEEILNEQGHIDEKRAIGIFSQICQGLQYAHTQGVIHRDLKPSNIMLLKDAKGAEIAKIVDFGIAKRTAVDQKVTQTGEVFGTPLYMSPEQCLGQNVDTRADIYSFGCLMYDVLSGHPPFEAANAVQTIVQHINEAPKPLRKMCEGFEVSSAIELVVAKCLEKDPQKRFKTVDQLADALDKVSEGSAMHYLRAPFKPRLLRNRSALFGWAIAAVLFAVIASVLAMVPGGFRYRPLDAVGLAPQWAHTLIKAENAGGIGGFPTKEKQKLMEQSLLQAKQSGNTGVLQYLYEQLFNSYAQLGESQKLIQVCIEAAEEAKSRGDAREALVTLTDGAQQLEGFRDYVNAANLYKQTEQFDDRSFLDPNERAVLDVRRAEVYLQSEQYADAEKLIRASLDRSSFANLSAELKFKMYRSLAYSLQYQKKFAEALRFYGPARKYGQEAGINEKYMDEVRLGEGRARNGLANQSHPSK